MGADIDARRLQHRVFSGVTASGAWRELCVPDPTRVRFRITSPVNFQLATLPNTDAIFAYIHSENGQYDLRRDIDGDIVTGGIWYISFGDAPAYWGFEVIDTHGHYYVKEV